MKIYATSDLHLDQASNFEAFLKSLPSSRMEACLILAGDICESLEQLELVFQKLSACFEYLVWTPGNHELWLRPSAQKLGKGSEEKYDQMIELCRRYKVYNPEDPYLTLQIDSGYLTLVPSFLLYDYSFRPEHVEQDRAVEWAMEADILCSDEALIACTRYPSVVEWCKARLDYTCSRLGQLPTESEVLIINHFPLTELSFELKRIPRFSIWCGTKGSETWHRDYTVKGVVTGHLHIPGHKVIDGVDFFEVSLGYPGQWDESQSMMNSWIELPY